MTFWYINDTEYFTENFCVNKEKKELQCNGRCHLKKSVENTQDESGSFVQVRILELEFLHHILHHKSSRIFSYLFKKIFNNRSLGNFEVLLEKETPPPNT